MPGLLLGVLGVCSNHQNAKARTNRPYLSIVAQVDDFVNSKVFFWGWGRRLGGPSKEKPAFLGASLSVFRR